MMRKLVRIHCILQYSVSRTGPVRCHWIKTDMVGNPCVLQNSVARRGYGTELVKISENIVSEPIFGGLGVSPSVAHHLHP